MPRSIKVVDAWLSYLPICTSFMRPSGAVKLDQHQCRRTDTILGAMRRREGGETALVSCIMDKQTDITFDLILLLLHFTIILYHYGKNINIIMEPKTISNPSFSTDINS